MTALKTAFFVLLVPGFLLGVVPPVVVQAVGGPALGLGAFHWLGLPCWLGGAAAVIWCAADFVRKGGGTPVPLDPPKELVVGGLYRYTRNPMYVGVLLVQLGTLVWYGSLAQAVYWLFLFIGFNLFIRANEEPHLRRTFGAAYENYCRSVPRWLPRLWQADRSPQ
jgi:protein-S-isoprenylcysteine O-methyltransferase Ste14